MVYSELFNNLRDSWSTADYASSGQSRLDFHRYQAHLNIASRNCVLSP